LQGKSCLPVPSSLPSAASSGAAESAFPPLPAARPPPRQEASRASGLRAATGEGGGVSMVPPAADATMLSVADLASSLGVGLAGHDQERDRSGRSAPVVVDPLPGETMSLPPLPPPAQPPPQAALGTSVQPVRSGVESAEAADAREDRIAYYREKLKELRRASKGEPPGREADHTPDGYSSRRPHVGQVLAQRAAPSGDCRAPRRSPRHRREHSRDRRRRRGRRSRRRRSSPWCLRAPGL